MSPTETALRAAVATAPDAALPRLVYADYLDDQNQPALAAAVRLDVALAGERPWSDRYWQLKAEQPADFPADLGRLADRQPLLCGVPDDWRSRWRAVRAFVSRWWGVPLGDVGRWGAHVEESERVTGRELPPSVKEWATFSNELAELDEEAFRDPLGFGRWPGGAAGDTIRLLLQAEGDLCWGALFTASDPAVLTLNADGMPYFTHSANTYSETVAGFALLYLLSYRADMTSVANYLATRTSLSAEYLHAGRFDLTEVFETPDRMTVLLPPGSWGYTQAQLFELN